MKISKIGEMRLTNVLIKDKKENPKQIESLLKSDLFDVLNNYFEINNIAINLDIVNGEYQISLHAIAKRVKSLKSLPV